jgi:hypothetical protein
VCGLRRVGVACIKQSSEAFAEAAAEVSGDLSKVLVGHEACARMKTGVEGRWME